MPQKKRRLILIRHGETEWNSAFRFQGQTDVPLRDAGRRQAELLAERLRLVALDRVYSSPLSRAFETASIITGRSSEAHNIITMNGLSEMCFGIWEGRSVSEIRESDPAFFLSWRGDPSSVSLPGGESFNDLVSRTASVFDEILSSGDGNILIVCHGGTIRAAFVSLLGISPASAWRVRVDNCSITTIDISPERTTLRCTNDTLHLKAASSLAGDLPL